jgi:cytidylate kinase
LKKIIIAIDGPAAAGKSTTAKLTAEKLNYLHVDTGAMYRALTLKVIEEQIDSENEELVCSVIKDCKIKLEKTDFGNQVFLDGRNITETIRSREVTRNVSAISSYASVRKLMVEEQRKLCKQGGVVLEGRDIGTVVVPKAELKIFMVASIEERVRRRQKELADKGTNIDYEKLVNEIIERDAKDSKRTESPLRKAEDAIILDTSNLTINQQVEFIVAKASEIIGHK